MVTVTGQGDNPTSIILRRNQHLRKLNFGSFFSHFPPPCRTCSWRTIILRTLHGGSLVFPTSNMRAYNWTFSTTQTVAYTFFRQMLLYPKNPDPSLESDGGFQSHPKRIGMDRSTVIPFLGHTWIHRDRWFKKVNLWTLIGLYLMCVFSSKMIVICFQLS